MKYHPDKCKAPGATEAFKAIGTAFAVLSDPHFRRQYDGNDGSSYKNKHHESSYYDSNYDSDDDDDEFGDDYYCYNCHDDYETFESWMNSLREMYRNSRPTFNVDIKVNSIYRSKNAIQKGKKFLIINLQTNIFFISSKNIF